MTWTGRIEGVQRGAAPEIAENAFEATKQDLPHRPTLRVLAAEDEGFCAGWN